MDNKLSRRDALKVMGIGAGAVFFPSESKAKTNLSMPASHKKVDIVIVGAGTGGMIASARLRRAAPNANITIIAPNKIHLYQAGQVFVAAGLYMQNDITAKTSELLEDNVKWVQDEVTSFEPDKNFVQTAKNGKIGYDYLIVALGLEYNYEAIKGLSADIIGHNGVASIYLNDVKKGVSKAGLSTNVWMNSIQEDASEKSVKVLYTQPDTSIKGVGADLDILFLSNDYFKGHGGNKGGDVSKNIENIYATPHNYLFPFNKYDKVIQNRVKKAGNINTLFEHNLIEIDSQKKIAIFKDASGKEIQEKYDYIHITPPMQAPKVFRDSLLSIKDGKYKGYMDVNPKTLQHNRYKNVFGIGDILGIPLAKTGGSAQVQGVVLQDNVTADIENKKFPQKYNGYTVSPVKLKYGEVLLAEFNKKKALPTFWLDPYKPRWIWWELDLHVMRYAYFSLMMRGMM